MLVDAHIPHITLRQVLQTTETHENELALAGELAVFLWEDMSEKALGYAPWACRSSDTATTICRCRR